MTKQEIFDKAAEGILRQGKRSKGDTCRYREDLTATCPIKCAAGHLIPDEKYKPVFDRPIAHNGVTGWPGPDDKYQDSPLFEIANEIGHHELVQNLQAIHDGDPIVKWPISLKHLAEDAGLNYEVVRKYSQGVI